MSAKKYLLFAFGILTIYWSLVYLVANNVEGDSWLLTLLGTDYVEKARSGDAFSFIYTASTFTIKVMLLTFLAVNWHKIQNLFKNNHKNF